MNEPAHTPVEDVAAPADANSRIQERLDRIEDSLQRIAAHQDIPLTDEVGPPKKASKPLLAAAFGFAGLKLGGFTLGKFGFAADIVNAYSRNKVEGLRDVVHSLFNAASKENGAGKNIPFMIATATIGGTVGTVGGVLLGWNRGDRLKSAGDLFTHPVNSMKKIFSSKPSLPVPAIPVSSPVSINQLDEKTPAAVSSPQHQGTVAAAPSVQLTH